MEEAAKLSNRLATTVQPLLLRFSHGLLKAQYLALFLNLEHV